MTDTMLWTIFWCCASVVFLIGGFIMKSAFDHVDTVRFKDYLEYREARRKENYIKPPYHK